MYFIDFYFFIQEQYSEKCIFKDIEQLFVNINQILLVFIKFDLSSGKEQ